MNEVVTKGPSEGKAFSILHQIFRIGIILKGLNATAEILGGAILLYFSTETLQGWIHHAVKPLSDKNPDSIIAKGAMTFSAYINPEGQAFAAWYLLSHGIIKIGVVFCLLRGWLWAYPLGIVVFVAFMVYQTWEYFMGAHSWTFMALNVFDGFMIWLTINEWRHAKHHLGEQKKSASPTQLS